MYNGFFWLQYGEAEIPCGVQPSLRCTEQTGSPNRFRIRPYFNIEDQVPIVTVT